MKVAYFLGIIFFFDSSAIWLSTNNITVGFKFFYYFFKCLFLRERESASKGRPERERHTESEAGCKLWVVSTEPNVAWNHKLWDHDLSWSWMLNQLSPQNTPWFTFLLIFTSIYFLFLVKIVNLFWKREREQEWGRGKEIGRERIPSRLRAVNALLDVGLKLMNSEIMTWAKCKS